MTALAPTLQAFFTDRLIGQLGASEHTIAAYRDTWRLLLTFTTARTSFQPARVDLAELDATLIAAFLDHLEHQRGNSVRTRNARLAAIHSLFTFASFRHPEHAQVIARVLYLSEESMALLNPPTPTVLEPKTATPDTSTRREIAVTA
jgi:integrase/recombinase XerD